MNHLNIMQTTIREIHRKFPLITEINQFSDRNKIKAHNPQFIKIQEMDILINQ